MFGITDLGTYLAACLGWINPQLWRGAVRTWRGEAHAAAAARRAGSFSTPTIASARLAAAFSARRRPAGTGNASVGVLSIGFGAKLPTSTL